MHEARAASALDHPNICTIDEIGETAVGQLFLAMAYIEGRGVDERSDVWALGIVSDELITGQREVAVLRAITDQTSRPLRDVRAENPIGRSRPSSSRRLSQTGVLARAVCERRPSGHVLEKDTLEWLDTRFGPTQ